MERRRLAGIITGWDILHKVAGPSEDLNAVTCGQIMTPNPMSPAKKRRCRGAEHDAHGGFRHVPVLRDDQIAGVIDAGDLFRDLSPNLV